MSTERLTAQQVEDLEITEDGLPYVDPAEARRRDADAKRALLQGFGERADGVVISNSALALLRSKKSDIMRKARFVPGYTRLQGRTEFLTYMDDLLRNGGTIPQTVAGNVAVRCPSCPAVLIVRADAPLVHCTCSPDRELAVWQHRVPLSERG